MSKEVHTLNGNFDGSKIKNVAIVASRFNEFVVESLIGGAVDCLVRHGVAEDAITVVRVPGALELPLACKKLADGKYEAVIALGAIIRGATSHYDVVVAESAKGVASVSLSSGKPVLNGILTVDTIEQAIERAGTKAGNKGAECALDAIELINLYKLIK